jgi:hypothetical protein
VDLTATAAVAVTIAVAAMSYAGAVTTHALMVFELPALLIALVVTQALVREGWMLPAIGAGGFLALAWSEVANLGSGQTNGPAARSALVLGGCMTLAVVAAAWRYPALFLLPVGGVVLGALLLGAGGEVRAVAIATVLVSVVALAAVELSARRLVVVTDRRTHTRPWSVLVMCLLVAGVATLLAVTQARHDGRTPHAGIAGVSNSQIRPSWGDPFSRLANSSARTAVATTPNGQKSSPQTTGAKQPPKHRHHTRWWLYALLLAVVLLPLGGASTRYLRVRRRWRRLRNRLESQDPANSISGAWVWTRLRLGLVRHPLPAVLSPESVPAYLDSRSESREALRDLAALVTTTAFAEMPVDEAAAAKAWTAADLIAAEATVDLGFLRRWQARFVAPTT